MSRVINDDEVWLLQVIVNLDERMFDVLFADEIVPAVLPPDLRRDLTGGMVADIVCAQCEMNLLCSQKFQVVVACGVVHLAVVGCGLWALV